MRQYNHNPNDFRFPRTMRQAFGHYSSSTIHEPLLHRHSYLPWVVVAVLVFIAVLFCH